MIILLKRSAVALSLAVLGVTVVRTQQPPPPIQRIEQFDNDQVEVWRSVITPNSPVPMHRHEHPRVIIALRGGTMTIVNDHGHSEEHVWETGKAYWLPAMPPNTKHSDVNKGDQPIEVMVVELMHEK